MKVLLVEDEEHKTTDLINRINSASRRARSELSVARSVREAVLQVISKEFDLVVLDMALPTFSEATKEDGGGGVSQAIGGVEVLRALQSVGRTANVIIVTQYPEIIISGERVKLHQIGRVVSQRYGQRVLGAVLYSFKTAAWETAFDRLVESVGS